MQFCRQLVPRGCNCHRTTLLRLTNRRFLSLGDLCNSETRQIIQTLFFLGGGDGWIGEEMFLGVCFPMILLYGISRISFSHGNVSSPPPGLFAFLL